nr:glutathione S-transferase N-terminal domain-containing protein [Novosphingobium panipatense]
MSITITAFEDSPDRGRGLARDMRVRWALEELGLAYDVRPLSFEEMKRPDYLALQPFGQIPSYVDDGLVLFESGAIVLHLAQNRPGLFPVDPNARARAVAWMFAALNTVEPPVFEWWPWCSNAKSHGMQIGCPCWRGVYMIGCNSCRRGWGRVNGLKAHSVLQTC